MFIEQIPAFIRWFFGPVVWRGNKNQRTIYLSFDDGPTPDVTPWVLQTLDDYGIKATFFCIGNNVEKHPTIFQEIINRGHAVGNHAYSHKRGLYRKHHDFLDDINKADILIKSNLFRPPHGNITPKQINLLHRKYKIILWDIITRDYDTGLSPQKVLDIVTKYSRNGSIVVFHDSLKAEKNLQYALPRAIEFWKNEGYSFEILH